MDVQYTAVRYQTAVRERTLVVFMSLPENP